jgi:hypothetical protein
MDQVVSRNNYLINTFYENLALFIHLNIKYLFVLPIFAKCLLNAKQLLSSETGLPFNTGLLFSTGNAYF